MLIRRAVFPQWCASKLNNGLLLNHLYFKYQSIHWTIQFTGLHTRLWNTSPNIQIYARIYFNSSSVWWLFFQFSLVNHVIILLQTLQIPRFVYLPIYNPESFQSHKTNKSSQLRSLTLRFKLSSKQFNEIHQHWFVFTRRELESEQSPCVHEGHRLDGFYMRVQLTLVSAMCCQLTEPKIKKIFQQTREQMRGRLRANTNQPACSKWPDSPSGKLRTEGLKE